MSFPVNVGQIPISYNELPTGRPYDPNNKYTSKYLDAPNAPLYPFGYGLSYTTFSLSSPHLSSTSVSRERHADRQREHHQHRIGRRRPTSCSSTCTRTTRASCSPSKKLEGFQRVTLAPGQSKTVTFTLGRQNLGFYNEQGQFVVEPGPFNLWVGDSSDVGTLTPSTFTVK